MSVGNESALCSSHHIAAAPEVRRGVINRDLADAVLVGEFDGPVDSFVGYCGSKFFISIPRF